MDLQEIITGQGHSSAVDWWALGTCIFPPSWACSASHVCSRNLGSHRRLLSLYRRVKWFPKHVAGILMYEMLYGRTPFRGRTRHKTFTNILDKDIAFPASIPVSTEIKLVFWIQNLKSACCSLKEAIFDFFLISFVYWVLVNIMAESFPVLLEMW
jgi:serine/threonine protein kinase